MSTDAIRDTLRFGRDRGGRPLLSTKDMALLASPTFGAWRVQSERHGETATAGEAFAGEPNGPSAVDIFDGFQRQCTLINPVAAQFAATALRYGCTVVIEGIHAVSDWWPEQVITRPDRLLSFFLDCAEPGCHRERFRTAEMGVGRYRNASWYLDNQNWNAIRALRQMLVNSTTSIVIDTAKCSVADVVDLVLGFVRRLERSSG